MVKKIVLRSVASIVTVLFALLLNYLALPAWNFASGGLWGYLISVIGFGTVVFAIFEYFIIDDYDEVRKNFVITFIFLGAMVLILVLMIVHGLIGCKMFNSSHYQEMIKIESGIFSEDIPAVTDINNITVVDMATAEKLGDRTIGGIKNSTWYEVDNEYNVIMYKGTQYRISPLNYGGLFKYNKATAVGIPGYVLVNSVTQEAQYVELEKAIMVSPSAYWGNDLKRVLRGKYSSYVFSDSYFEIDEDGNPYWVTAVTTPTISLWKARKITSVIVTDACTGDSKEYQISEVPEWVDHIYPLDYLMKLVNYSYKYINGFWNFSNTGVNKTSFEYKDEIFTGYNTIVNADNEVVFYSGITPANNAESNLGFILASPRTGIVKYYECTGAEESSAQAAAEGLVQNLGYTATFPTVINVNEIETYFMALKDNAGLIQRYSLCEIANYTNVVEAKTLEESLQKYLEILGAKEVENKEKENFQESGAISSLYQAQIEGYTYYYFTINSSEKLYMSSIKNNNKQVAMKVGDKITIEYTQTSESDVFMVEKITIG